MTLLELKKTDVDEITAFYEKEFKDGWTKGMLISAFDGGRFFALGIKDDGDLVGIITFSVSYDDADIEGVVVRKDKRRSGIASALIRGAEEKLSALNIKKILLEVREANAPARALYEKFNFQMVSVRKNYYADGESAVVMLKEIVE